MRFVDRSAELRRLRRAARGGEGGVIVVWGRRRVGKTRLLVEWLRGTGGVYWVADASAAPVQRRYLAQSLEVRLPGFAQAEYADWGALFGRMARDAAREGWRGPLVLDELPYLVESSPELPSVLQRFVDHEARVGKLLLVLAGSSQRMMQGLVLGAEAPLYGRAKEVMKLEPLPAGHLGAALELSDPEQIVRSYGVWGGLPRYWELAAPFRNLRDAVDAQVLDPLGPLHDEPARLLLEELPPATAIRPLMDAIGAGAHRVSEIAGRLGRPATSLTRPLTRLQELGLVVREIPFGEPERSGKRALYKLADPFLRFWFAVVAPRRGWLAQVDRAARLDLFDRLFPRLVSVAWEDLCREAIPRLAWGGARFAGARRFWSGTGREWDAVAASEDGRSVLLGEAAWSDADADRMLGDLRARGVPDLARRPERIHYALFARRFSGRRPRAADVHLIDARRVLSALRD